MTICSWEINRTFPQLRFIPRIVAFLEYDPYDANSPKDLAQRIASTRQRLGITQRKLAQQLGIDPSTLGRWERGIGQPSERLASALDAFLDEALSGDQSL